MNQEQNNLRQEALAFADMLAEQYFVKRKLDELPQYMDANVSWIGTGKDETSKNLEEAKKALSQELKEYGGSFSIKSRRFEALVLSEDVCVVYGEIQADPNDSALSSENLRLSLVVKKTSEGMKLEHIHFSYPDLDQEQGHYYVARAARNNVMDLKRTLDMRSRQLDILNRNIPGSAHQCRNDENFTLISMSDSFLSMFGYTREEVGELFHNNFIEMVYPNDREGLIEAAREQLKKGRNIELEYRVLCKNGHPV